MKETDAESDRRHRELIGLSLRADRLRVDRAFSDLASLYATVDRLDLPTSLPILTDIASEARDKTIQDFLIKCRKKARAIDQFRRSVNSEDVGDCSDLFDGVMSRALQDFNEATDEFQRFLERAASTASSFDPTARDRDTPLVKNRRKEGLLLLTSNETYVDLRDDFIDTTYDFLEHAEGLLEKYHMGKI